MNDHSFDQIREYESVWTINSHLITLVSKAPGLDDFTIDKGKKSGAYNLANNLKLFLWFEDQKLLNKDPFWSLVELVAKYNSVDILQTANKVEDDMEGHSDDEEDDEEEEEEEEEEDEVDSEVEIEDEPDTLLFSCPFCMGCFEEKVEMEEHVDICMTD